MEEAEALCNKMGIMVKGEFKCFGPATRIKDKYGTGFEIEFKIRSLFENELASIEASAQQNNLLPFTIAKCKQFLVQNGLVNLANEMSMNGIGFEFVEMERKRIPIKAKEFLQW